MAHILLGLALTAVATLFILVADDLLKAASDTGSATLSRPVLGGAVLYLASAFVWFYAMRHIPLAQAAVAYSMLSLVGLVGLGVLAFGEAFGWRDASGLGCALPAMALILRV